MEGKSHDSLIYTRIDMRAHMGQWAVGSGQWAMLRHHCVDLLKKVHHCCSYSDVNVKGKRKRGSDPSFNGITLP